MADPPDRPSDSPPAIRIAAAKCVRCSNPVTPRARPFCSQRCADIDLGGWLTERYRVAGAPAAPEGANDDEES